MQRIMKYIKLLRVKHWMKNLLMFFPIVFSGNLFERQKFFRNIEGFISFCIVSSIVYIVNDYIDIEKDKLHPIKKKRPLASGDITKKQAGIVLLQLTLLVIGVGGLYLQIGIMYLIIYIIINILYSVGLKNIPILDVTILAFGYIIRLLYGGVLAGTGVSNWMLLTVLMASYFLGFGKRRNELLQYGDETRTSLKKYNHSFLDKSMSMFLTLTIVFYALTCADEDTAVAKQGVNMLWTVPLVIFICLRYSMLIENDCNGDPIEMIVQDKLIFLLVLCYAALIIILLYI